MTPSSQQKLASLRISSSWDASPFLPVRRDNINTKITNIILQAPGQMEEIKINNNNSHTVGLSQISDFQNLFRFSNWRILTKISAKLHRILAEKY